MEISIYEKFFTPNLILLTCRTVGDEPVLGSPEMVRLLRSVLREVRDSLNFRLVAYAFLPTHVHLLTGWENEGMPDRLLAELTSRYDREYQLLMGNPQPMTVWQKRVESQAILEVETFAACLDAIHYDPVRHGFVERPEEWPDTSYEDWVERSLYKLGWGWHKPETIKELTLDKL